MTTETEMRRIYDGWHDAVVARDLAAVTALYAEDAVFESPLVVATQPELGEGILRGRAAISAFFAAGFAATAARGSGVPLSRWYRTGVFFANGRQLAWEYPRATPEGDQTDLMEMMEIDGGLIRHHRVYWGWVGFKRLAALRPGATASPGTASGRSGTTVGGGRTKPPAPATPAAPSCARPDRSARRSG